METLRQVLRFHVMPSVSINEAGIEAIKIAKERQVIVKLDFNGIEIDAWGHETSDEIVSYYYKVIEHKAKRNERTWLLSQEQSELVSECICRAYSQMLVHSEDKAKQQRIAELMQLFGTAKQGDKK